MYSDDYEDLWAVYKKLKDAILKLNECDSSRDFEQDAMDLVDRVAKGEFDPPKSGQ